MSKSLCLGWSCETGPSRNITTVIVFENTIQIVTLRLVFDGRWMYLFWPTYWAALCVHFPHGLFRVCLSFINLSILSYFITFSVFVRLPDGAAMRAGVQTGDRIIKVLCSSASVLKQPVSRSPVLSQHRVCRLPPCGHVVFPTPLFSALKLYGSVQCRTCRWTLEHFLILLILQLLFYRLTGPLLHILITLRWWS